MISIVFQTQLVNMNASQSKAHLTLVDTKSNTKGPFTVSVSVSVSMTLILMLKMGIWDLVISVTLMLTHTVNDMIFDANANSKFDAHCEWALNLELT